jgi:hypothetical protein
METMRPRDWDGGASGSISPSIEGGRFARHHMMESRMNIATRIAAATLVGAALSTAAVAQPVIVGSGVDTTIVAPNPNGPVWGGAIVRQVGSGESAQIEVIDAQNSQPGRTARVVGSGESAQVVYDAPVAAAPVGTALGLATGGLRG